MSKEASKEIGNLNWIRISIAAHNDFVTKHKLKNKKSIQFKSYIQKAVNTTVFGSLAVQKKRHSVSNFSLVLVYQTKEFMIAT